MMEESPVQNLSTDAAPDVWLQLRQKIISTL